jgi:hypothetical protein
MLLHRSAGGPVPGGTRRIRVSVTFDRFDGVCNNGYADDLRLTLSCAATNAAPILSSTGTACGSILPVDPGSPVAFTVSASDPNAGDVVTLVASGLPAGATLSPPLPATGSHVSTALSWVPEPTQIGDHTVEFTASDACGLQTQCRIGIRVKGVVSEKRMTWGRLKAMYR